MILKLYRLNDCIRFCNVIKVNSYRCSHSISFYKNQNILDLLVPTAQIDALLLDLVLLGKEIIMETLCEF